METETSLGMKESVKCCDCGCNCVLKSFRSVDFIRSVKRKFDEFQEGNNVLVIPGFDYSSVARVQVENECEALRETVSSQQQTIQDLYMELEEERNAASSATTETMSMILRLQRDKAEVQMEARQYKRFVEEKMAHEQQEFLALEDLLYKREQMIQSLTCEVQAYKHRMWSYGLTEAGSDVEKGDLSRAQSMNEGSQFDLPLYDYPPLKINVNEASSGMDNDVEDVEKYAFGETPRDREDLKNLEYRISQMERVPSSNQFDGDFPVAKTILEKVTVRQSPRRGRHNRRFSNDSPKSPLGCPREYGPDFTAESPRPRSSFKKMEYVSPRGDYPFIKKIDSESDFGDGTNDRVYTIDSIHKGVPYNDVPTPKPAFGICEDYITTPRGSFNMADVGEPDIMKLYTRLQALEADRESMKQALMSMRTDKAQLVLLREIAQQLCKEKSPERRTPVMKPSLFGSFSLKSIVKWTVSFISWRKKACRNKFLYGLTTKNAGLRMLLDKSPRARRWRCLTNTNLKATTI